MKLALLTSLRTKLFFSLALLLLLTLGVSSYSVYTVMHRIIKADRVHELSDQARLKYQVLKTEFIKSQQTAEDLLSSLEKFCGLQGGFSRAQSKCIYDRLKVANGLENIKGLALLDFDSKLVWTVGQIQGSEVQTVQFRPRQQAWFPSGQGNPGQGYYLVQAQDLRSHLRLLAAVSTSGLERTFNITEEENRAFEFSLSDGYGNFIFGNSGERISNERQWSERQGSERQGSVVNRVSPDGQEGQDRGINHAPEGGKGLQMVQDVPEIGNGYILARVDEDGAFPELDQLLNKIMLGLLLFALAALCVLYFLTRYLVKPVAYLAHLARLISEGNYHLCSTLRRNDELGILSEAINQMRTSLLDSEAHFKLAIDNIKDYAITLLDSNGRITNWNSGIEKIHGYSDFDVRCRHFEIFFDPRDRRSGLQKALLASALSSGRHEVELEMTRKNGEPFSSQLTVTSVVDGKQRHRGFICVCRDITEKKKLEYAEIEAQKANLQKTSFLACLSHEIRTPLNSILGVTELLKEKKDSPEDRKLLSVAHASGETLLAILNDTLDLSRIESGEVKLDRTVFRLSEQLQLCLAMMEIRAKEKKIRLELKIEDHLHDCFRGDPIRLRQILMNLMSNAIKFSEGGVVALEARMGQGLAVSGKGVSIILSVRDEGIGIAENQKQLIFDRFKQADDSVTRRYGGVGLGLNITKRLVEMMDGRIWVDSLVGRGSTFFVSLILKPEFALPLQFAGLPVDDQEQSPVLGLAMQNGGDPSKIKLLLVDDSEENRFIFSAFLEKVPVEITYAENGQQALDEFKQNKFDIVFMDVQMPIMDGYSATRHIRNWEFEMQRSPCPIIACTANALEDDLRLSQSAGCDDHLSKPVSKQKLLLMLSQFFTARRIEGHDMRDKKGKVLHFSATL